MTVTTGAGRYTEASYADEWQAATDELAAQAGRTALALYVAWQAGRLTDGEWQRLFAEALLKLNATGIAVGDGLVSRLLHLAHGYDVRPVGLDLAAGLVADLARLDRAVASLAEALDDAEDPRGRIVRLATSEPVNAAQQAAVAASRSYGISGYVRGTDADPCELCVWLRKEHLRPGGYIYPTSKAMYRHPGCQCVPIPATATLTRKD